MNFTRFSVTRFIALASTDTYDTFLRSIHPEQDMALLDSIAHDIGLAPGVYLIDDATLNQARVVTEQTPGGNALGHVFIGVRYAVVASDEQGQPTTLFVSDDPTESERVQAGLLALLTSQSPSAGPASEKVEACDRSAYNKRGELLVIDGTAEDGTYQGDGENAPFVVFNVERQTNVAGTFSSLDQARAALLALSFEG